MIPKQPQFRILLVDDDPSIQASFKKYYSRLAHYEITVAATAEEALEILNRVDPDVVIVDVLLPDEDGIKLISSFKQKSHAVLPIVISGVVKNTKFKNELEQKKIPHFFVKPLDMALIKEVIDERYNASVVKLANRNLPKIIEHIEKSHLDCILQVEHNEIFTRLHFKQGSFQHIQNDIPNQLVGQLLIQNGYVKEAELDEALSFHKKNKGMKLLTALVELCYLSPHMVKEAMIEQFQKRIEKLRSALVIQSLYILKSAELIVNSHGEFISNDQLKNAIKKATDRL